MLSSLARQAKTCRDTGDVDDDGICAGCPCLHLLRGGLRAGLGQDRRRQAAGSELRPGPLAADSLPSTGREVGARLRQQLPLPSHPIFLPEGQSQNPCFLSPQMSQHPGALPTSNLLPSPSPRKQSLKWKLWRWPLRSLGLPPALLRNVFRLDFLVRFIPTCLILLILFT